MKIGPTILPKFFISVNSDKPKEIESVRNKAFNKVLPSMFTLSFMKRKVLPLVALLILSGIANLAAQTTITVTTNADEDDGSNSLNNLNDISLREAINHAPDGAEILINQTGFVLNLTEGPLEIDKDLTIEGAISGTRKPTIQGDGQSRLLEINSEVEVTITGLRLTGGSATGSSPDDRGGAIYLNEASLTLDLCDLVENSAGAGGAIYNFCDDFESTLNINRTTVANNSADLGGGIAVFGDRRDSFLNLENSSILENSARLGGGIYYFTERRDTRLNVTNCTIAQNTATSEGGGLYSSATEQADVFITLTTSTLTLNTAPGGGGIANIAEDEADIIVTIRDIILAGNDGNRLIGRDYLEVGDDTTTQALNTNGFSLISDVIGSSLQSTGNSNPRLIQVSTGGSGDISIVLSALGLAPLGNYGGPTQTFHPLRESIAIRSNTTTRTDQRGFTTTGPQTIGAVKLGPLFIVDQLGDDPNASGTLRSALAASANVAGAVIQLNVSPITLTQGPLVIDEANSLFVDGFGTIDGNEQSRIFTIDSNAFESATISIHGLTLQGGRATGSSGASGRGGCLFVDGDFVTLSSCRLLDNEAEFDGGAIYSRASDGSNDAAITLRDCFFENNHAGTFGGAVTTIGGRGTSSLTFSDTTFSNNSADQGGGAVATSGSEATLEVTGSDSTFSQNTSDLGGAFYAEYSQASAIIAFETCVFEENTALTHGGALYNQASDTFGSLNITNSLFAKNSAGQNGGGLYSTGEVGDVILNLLNCTLAQNSADFGGALFALDSFSGTVGSTAVSLEHCTIAQNTATSAGGGLFAQALDEGNLLLELNNTILASNTAPLGPDLREDSEANATIEVDLLGANIFSSVAGSSLSESASGLFLSQNPVAPLGNYGGPTRTLHPLSEAILPLPETTRTDQRGFTLTGPLTPGSVQAGPVTIVDNLGDDVTTSTTLRKAIADAANQEGAIIQFAPSLAGQTITLTEGTIRTQDQERLFLDGAGLDITIRVPEESFKSACS